MSESSDAQRPTSVVDALGRWAGRLDLLSALFGGLSLIYGMLLGGLLWLEHSLTEPIAGHTAHYSFTNGSPNSQCSIWRYEVFNPGPANLEGLELHIEVDEKLAEGKDSFPQDTLVDKSTGVPCKIQRESCGHGALIKVWPEVNGKPVPLQEGKSFGLNLFTPVKDWKPVDANAFHEGKSYPAKDELNSKTAPAWRRVIRIISVFLPFVVGIAFYALYWRAKKSVRANLEKVLQQKDVEFANKEREIREDERALVAKDLKESGEDNVATLLQIVTARDHSRRLLPPPSPQSDG